MHSKVELFIDQGPGSPAALRSAWSQNTVDSHLKRAGTQGGSMRPVTSKLSSQTSLTAGSAALDRVKTEGGR
eukprot:5527273-Amphidinium_carterae.1